MASYAVKMVQLSYQEALFGISKNALLHPALVFAASLRRSGLRLQAQSVEQAVERIKDCRRFNIAGIFVSFFCSLSPPLSAETVLRGGSSADIRIACLLLRRSVMAFHYRVSKCSGADSAKCGMVCLASLGVLPRYYYQTASLPLSLCASLSVALLSHRCRCRRSHLDSAKFCGD